MWTVSLSEFLPYYLSDTTNLKLIKSGVDYDEVTGHETTTMFRVLYASQNSNWELDTHHMRSQFAVAYNEDKLTFGYLTITDKINFNHNLDSTLLENLFTDANDAYNVSNPTEFYNKIKKITFATYPFSNGEKITRQSDGELVVPVTRTHKHIVSVLFNENQYNKRLAVDALISYQWSFDYLDGSWSPVELKLQQEQHNYEISIYNFSQDYFYADGTGSLVDDISTFGYQLNTSTENNYRYYEPDGFNGDHIHDRGEIVTFGLGTEIRVVDNCTFEPPTPTPSRTTSYTPSPSITPSPTPSCDLSTPYDIDETLTACDINDSYETPLLFTRFDKLPELGGRGIYEGENAVYRMVVYYDHDNNRWWFEKQLKIGANEGQIFISVSAFAMCCFHPWEATWPGEDWNEYANGTAYIDVSNGGSIDLVNHETYFDGEFTPATTTRTTYIWDDDSGNFVPTRTQVKTVSRFNDNIIRCEPITTTDCDVCDEMENTYSVITDTNGKVSGPLDFSFEYSGINANAISDFTDIKPDSIWVKSVYTSSATIVYGLSYIVNNTRIHKVKVFSVTDSGLYTQLGQDIDDAYNMYSTGELTGHSRIHKFP